MMNGNGRKPWFSRIGTPPAIMCSSRGKGRWGNKEREITMSNEKSFLTRAMAAFGAVSMSLAIMVSYFATPEVQAMSGVLA